MKPKLFIFIFCAFLSGFSLYAGPARRGEVYLQQPDGSVFSAYVRGDEHVRIKTTKDGHGIVQETDGWWCYAEYLSDGKKISSGWRVGEDVPQHVLHKSLMIPYSSLAEMSSIRRKSSAAKADEVSILKRIRPSADTRSEGGSSVTKHGIVILAQFRDVSFKYDKEDFVRLLTEDGYSDNGATGCAKEYFDDQFNGNIIFDFHVSSIVTLSKNRSYYGGNDADGSDKMPAEMVSEACEKADAEIDFSLYDDDGDGVVDNVFVFFAGPDEAEGADEECIWSHAWYIWSGAGISLTLDGKQIDRYACTSELTRQYGLNGRISERLNGIGTFCHEYSHTFGLPDFYDTDYEKEGGWAAGLWGSTSLMDSGNQNNGGNTPPYYNAVERELLGLTEPVVIDETGRYSLAPVHESNVVYRLDTDTEDEYYLFECRYKEGWDKYIGGSGMLVYHVDRSSAVLEKWTYYNTVNADHSHQCVDIIEADSRKDNFVDDREYVNLTSNIKGIFFPYADITSLTPDGTPALKFWSGASSMKSITGIRRDGENISFNLVDSDDSSSPPVALEVEVEAFADAAIVRFISSFRYDGKAVVTWGRTGNLTESMEISPYSPGNYAILLDGLEPTGKTYTVEIKFIRNGVEGNTQSISFMTKRKPPVTWPSIVLGNVDRTEEGTFAKYSRIPFYLYGCSGAEAVEWFFNDQPVSHEGDFYYTVEESGILKAVVFWEDGGKDVIMKEIIVR